MKTTSTDRRTLWLRWLCANSFGELFGLGSTFAVIAWVFSVMDDQAGTVAVLASFLVAAASGGIEATLVGLAQWWAMHPWLPSMARRTWWMATLIGALVAYVLGYLPATFMSLSGGTSQSQVAEPTQGIVLLLAGGLGAVAGAVLSFAQWLALRRKVPRAGWWIPANMLAWLVGMPIIFWGIDVAQRVQPIAQTVLLLAVSLLLAGAVVGGIHGLVLIRLIGPSNPRM